MGKITGFMELQRVQEAALPVEERVRHYREFVLTLKDEDAEVRWRAWGRPVLRAPRAGRRRCGCGAREAWGPQGGQRGRVAWR